MNSSFGALEFLDDFKAGDAVPEGDKFGEEMDFVSEDILVILEDLVDHEVDDGGIAQVKGIWVGGAL